MTGDGMDDFFVAVQDARKEYYDEYKPELDRVVRERREKTEKEQQANLAKLLKDLNVSAPEK
jgi:hypothetical protein